MPTCEIHIMLSMSLLSLNLLNSIRLVILANSLTVVCYKEIDY